VTPAGWPKCSDNEYLGHLTKGPVGGYQHAIDVVLAQCGRHERVVFGMNEDAAGGALGRPLPAPGPTPRQAEGACRYRQFGVDRHLPPAVRPHARFCDLGPGYYESRINKHRRARDLATQLQALTGQHIAIRDGKVVITDTAA
jgi:hypothetical protein